MSGFLGDLRYAARMLFRSPGFAAAAVLTLALGIGANTAIFSVLNPILFEPLPYPHASRVMMIWDIFQGARSDVTFHTFREISSRSHAFESTAVLEPWRPTISGRTEPERLEGQSVSASYFRALGITPFLGRDFQSPDEAFHGPKVVILSNALWARLAFAESAVNVGLLVLSVGLWYLRMLDWAASPSVNVQVLTPWQLVSFVFAMTAGAVSYRLREAALT